MTSLVRVKEIVEQIPEELARPFVWVPYSIRLGPAYWTYARSVARSDRASPSVVSMQQLVVLRRLLSHAVSTVPFYRDLFIERGFSPKDLRSWDDWNHVPIVTKSDLLKYPLEARKAVRTRGLKVNTGGTSGAPLDFFLDGEAFAREWAHMHYLWRAHGYRPQHLKLTFRGKRFEGGRALRYNVVHNEYVVNANAPMEVVVKAVSALPRSKMVRWLHGYPSLVAEFAQEMARSSPHAQAVFRARLFGVLLGSEYPAPVYRSVIEKVLSSNVVSWYGHSEMAVLARETAHGLYESMPTYGYAEAVPQKDGEACRLVCTSLHNDVHPFIRYDTGDLIEPVSLTGGSLAFRVTEGRVGDFVRDSDGRKHSLTAIIFGRHHRAFNLIQHLQVREDAPGRVTLMVTPRSGGFCLDRIRKEFDLDDLNIEWKMEILETPVRTAAGKIQLKV